MKNFFCFTIASLFFFANAYSQGTKVMFAMDDLNKSSEHSLFTNGLSECKLVYGDFINPKNSDTLVTSVFIKEINRLFPNPQDNGFCALDWEGKVYDRLFKDNVSDEDFNKSLVQFTKAIALAKKLRPNVKWGFWGIPGYYFKMSHEKRLQPLFRQVDVIFPELYVRDPKISFDKTRLANSIELGRKYDKLVYPFVWNRITSLDARYRHRLISDKDFLNYVNAILKFKSQGKKIEGVVWWGRDSWFYKAYKTAAHEAPDFETFQKQYFQRVSTYSKELGRLK
ncbi:MAG TPA: hypothetical protein VN040_10505 [Pseudosphingobacterium sp.]|nr:hypothetical protein [Pseudosphingobacterium sp.]